MDALSSFYILSLGTCRGVCVCVCKVSWERRLNFICGLVKSRGIKTFTGKVSGMSEMGFLAPWKLVYLEGMMRVFPCHENVEKSYGHC